MKPAPEMFEVADESEMAEVPIVYPIGGTPLQGVVDEGADSSPDVLGLDKPAISLAAEAYRSLHEDTRSKFPRLLPRGLTPTEDDKPGIAIDSSDTQRKHIFGVVNDIAKCVRNGATKILVINGTDLLEALLDALSCCLSREEMADVNLSVVVSRDKRGTEDARLCVENGFESLNYDPLKGHIAAISGSVIHLGRGLVKKRNPLNYPLYYNAYPALGWVDGVGEKSVPVSFRENAIEYNPDIDQGIFYPYGTPGEPFLSAGPVPQKHLNELSEYSHIPDFVRLKSTLLKNEVRRFRREIETLGLDLINFPQTDALLASANGDLRGLSLIAPGQGNLRSDETSEAHLKEALGFGVPIAVSAESWMTWGARGKVKSMYSGDASRFEKDGICCMQGFTPSEVRMILSNAIGRADHKGLEGDNLMKYVFDYLGKFRDRFGGQKKNGA